MGRHRCDATTTGATTVHGVAPHPALCATFSRQREKGCLAARDLPVAPQLTTHRALSAACGGSCPKGGWGRHRCDATTTGATAVHGVAPHPALRATFSRQREKGCLAARDLPVARQLTTHLLPSPACGGRCPKGGWGRHRCNTTTTGATAVHGVAPHPALRATFSRQRQKGCLAERDVGCTATDHPPLPSPACGGRCPKGGWGQARASNPPAHPTMHKAAEAASSFPPAIHPAQRGRFLRTYSTSECSSSS
ncbi:hypothetical protein FHR55_000454 [Xanthomonas arboricola]